MGKGLWNYYSTKWLLVVVLLVIVPILAACSGKTTVTQTVTQTQGQTQTITTTITPPAVTETIIKTQNQTQTKTETQTTTVTLPAVTTTLTIQAPEVIKFRGFYPSDAVMISDGSRLYIPCYQTQNLLVIGTNQNKVIGAIDLSGIGPLGIHAIDAAITPNGEKIYLADDMTTRIAVVSTVTNQVTGLIDFKVEGGVNRVEVSPDGEFAYVTFEGGGLIPVIEVASDTVRKYITIEDEAFIYLVAFSADGSRAFLADSSGSGRVYVVDTSSHEVIDQIDLGFTGRLHPQASMVVAPDDTKIYLTSGPNEGQYARPESGTNRVIIIDLASRSVEEIEVIGGPQSITLSPDGQLGYVSTFSAKKIIVIDLVNQTVLGEFDWSGYFEGAKAYGRTDLRNIVILPNGRDAYLVGWDASAAIALDLLDRKVTGAIELNPILGAEPVDIVITPDGQKAYVPTWGRLAPGERHGIAVLDTDTNSIVTKILLEHCDGPRRIDMSQDGRFLYIPASPKVFVVDTVKDEVVAEVTTQQPTVFHDAAVLSDQNKLYVSFGAGDIYGGIYVIDLLSNEVVKEINVGREPTSIVLTPDGKWLYVNRIFNPSDEGGLVVIDTETDQVVDTITPPEGKCESQIAHFASPVAVTPDGVHIYWSSGTLWVNVVDVASNKVLRTIDFWAILYGLPIAPSSIAFSSDGTLVYITCLDAGYVTVWDVTAEEFISVIKVGLHPIGVAITPDDRFAYVANMLSEDVSVIDLANNKVIATIPMGSPP